MVWTLDITLKDMIKNLMKGHRHNKLNAFWKENAYVFLDSKEDGFCKFISIYHLSKNNTKILYDYKASKSK